MAMRHDETNCPLSRRSFLAGSGALFAWSFMPYVASAAGSRDARFLTIILRGGLDGLSAVPAVGDPDYARLRRDLAMQASGPNAVIPLDSTFALHPRMTNLHRLYGKQEAIIVHAVATPYRERSHFDGQDVLETGLARPGGRDGWLNRALAELPRGQRLRSPKGIGIGPTTPLILQGGADVTSWSPPTFQQASEETVRRLQALYTARDPALDRALREGIAIGRTAAQQGMGRATPGGDAEKVFVEQATAAAKFMALDDGPRVAAMSFDGWDTHADQGPQSGRLARLLGALDATFGALERGLGPVWKQTVVAVVTEFGRTAHENGSIGTDHGTATVAFLLGGAVAGGRIVADWPGLADEKLFEKRDLAPTTDLRAVFKGVLADHLGVSARALSERVFPGTEQVAAVKGLIRS
jgi:uncharacterized protein (DUF1501 family)